MSAPEHKQQNADRTWFTFVFKDAAQAAKLAGYWSVPPTDELKLQRRGWPAPSAWTVHALTLRDGVVHVIAACDEHFGADPLPEPLRKGVPLALMRVQGASDYWLGWSSGRDADLAKMFDRVVELELYDADSLLSLALRTEQAAVVKRAVALGPSRAALTAGVFHQPMTVTRVLLEAGADAQARGGHGETLLMHWATNKELVARLLKAGVDPNAVTSAGNTPLVIAVADDADACVKALIKAGADVNAGTPPPLLAAARTLEQNRSESAKATLALLLSRGAQSGLGEVMHYAERSPAVREVVEGSGRSAPKQAPARKGSLPQQLHAAIRERDWDGADTLVESIMAQRGSDEALQGLVEAVGACLAGIEELRGAAGSEKIDVYLRTLGSRRREWCPAPKSAHLVESDPKAEYLGRTRTDVSLRACFDQLEDAERFAAYCKGERDARDALMAKGFPDPDAWAFDATLRDGRSVRAGAGKMPNADVEPLIERLTHATVAMLAIVYLARGYQPSSMIGLIANPVRSFHYASGGKPTKFEEMFATMLEQDPSLALSIALEHLADEEAAMRAAARGANPFALVDSYPALFSSRISPELALALIDGAPVDTRIQLNGQTLYHRWAREPKIIARLTEHAARLNAAP